MTVLHEEIIKSVHSMTEEKAIQPMWLMFMASVSTIGMKAAETGDGDGPASSPCAYCSQVMCTSQYPAVHESHSPPLHASHSPTPHMSGALVPHSPLKSPSAAHCYQSSRSSSSSSSSSSGSGSVSGSGSSGSSESGSGDESSTNSAGGSQAPPEGSRSSSSCSASPEVVLVQIDDEDAAADEEDKDHPDDEEAMSQGRVSLLDISKSDNEEARKVTAHEKACKSDVQFTAWCDEQICQGNEAIAWCDKQVHDYTDTGSPSKDPDKIGPLLTYMKECGVFKPLDTIVNLLGLCRFYRTDPKKSNVITGLKSTSSIHKIKHLLGLAKELGRLLTIVVFEDGTVTPLGLLQELDSHLTLSCITISMPEEVKVGPKNRICHQK